MQNETSIDFDNLRCPKCSNSMTRGYTTRPIFVIVRPRSVLAIGTFRCESCGYLEEYARPEFASKQQFSLRGMFVVFTIIAVAIGILAAIFHARN
jgi:hypothetical protein